MTLDSIIQGFDIINDLLGVPVTLKRKHTVTTVAEGDEVTSLKAKDGALLGATSLTLEANDGLPVATRGIIPEGLTLTIDGNDYVTTAEVEIDDDEATVGITPGLLGAVSIGDTVTLADTVDFAFTALRKGAEMREVDLSMVAADEEVFALKQQGAPVTPRQGDYIVSNGRIRRVKGFLGGNAGVAWRVIVG